MIKKCLCTWWLQYRKLQVMSKVSPANLQIFIDTQSCVLEDRVQYSRVHFPNVFCVGHLLTINCVGNACFLYCNYQVRRDFLITLYNDVISNHFYRHAMLWWQAIEEFKRTVHLVSSIYLLLMRLLHVSAPTCHPQGGSLSSWVREN
jgi:hypothetical protein